MSRFEDLTGRKFGRLIVIKRDITSRRTKWICKCECGNIKSVYACHLKDGSSTSCGCFQKEKAKQSNSKHGYTKTSLHNRWKTMKQRCCNKNDKNYKNYGGRGITVCDEWKDVNNFFEWAIANGYQENLEIDRIDNNKGYFPENCRWATRQEQMNNTRKTHNIFICNVKFNLYKLMSEYLISKYVFKKTSIEDIPEKERFLFLLCCKWGRK